MLLILWRKYSAFLRVKTIDLKNIYLLLNGRSTCSLSCENRQHCCVDASSGYKCTSILIWIQMTVLYSLITVFFQEACSLCGILTKHSLAYRHLLDVEQVKHISEMFYSTLTRCRHRVSSVYF